MGKFLEVPGSRRMAACVAKILRCAMYSNQGLSWSQAASLSLCPLTLFSVSSLLPLSRCSTPGLAWMHCRSTPSARPMPTRGQGEPAGRAQVSVSGRSPVPACFLGRRWD